MGLISRDIIKFQLISIRHQPQYAIIEFCKLIVMPADVCAWTIDFINIYK